MTPKLLGSAAAAVIFVALVLVAVLSFGGSDNEDGDGVAVATATVPASPTGGASPTVQPNPHDTPAATPVADPFVGFTLSPVTDALEFVAGVAADVPAGTGLYVLDIDTGELEGWHATGDLYAGPRFSLAPDNRLSSAEFGLSLTPDRRLLADRETRTVYEWQGGARPVVQPDGFLVAAGSRVLFRVPDPEGEDWFAVVDLEADPPVIAGFQAEAWSGLLSRDGSQAVVVGESLQVFDIASGAFAWTGTAILHEPQPGCLEFVEQLQRDGLEANPANYTIRNTLDDEGFLLQSEWLCPGRPGPASWLRYAWDGNLVASGDVAVLPGPNGEMAWYQIPDSELPIVEAIDLQDGSSVYRVVGAASGPAHPVVLLPREGGQRIWATATFQGGIQPLAADGAVEVTPAPGDRGVFARRFFDISLLAFDAQGNEFGGYAPDPNASFQGVTYGMAPWGGVPTELRFVAGPRGSDDCCASYSFVVPYVEAPPYSPEPVVHLREEALGAEIRNVPAGDTVLGNLTTLRVSLKGTSRLNTEGTDPRNALQCEFFANQAGIENDCRAPHSGLWLHVLSEDGVEGWILVEAGGSSL